MGTFPLFYEARGRVYAREIFLPTKLVLIFRVFFFLLRYNRKPIDLVFLLDKKLTFSPNCTFFLEHGWHDTKFANGKNICLYNFRDFEVLSHLSQNMMNSCRKYFTTSRLRKTVTFFKKPIPLSKNSADTFTKYFVEYEHFHICGY